MGAVTSLLLEQVWVLGFHEHGGAFCLQQGDARAGGCSEIADVKIRSFVPLAAMKRHGSVCFVRTVKCLRHLGVLSTFILSGQLFLANYDHIEYIYHYIITLHLL